MKSDRSWPMHTQAYHLDAESVLPKKAAYIQLGSLQRSAVSGQRSAVSGQRVIVPQVGFWVFKGQIRDADEVLSVADQTLSMMDKTFPAADQTLSMADQTFSAADKTFSMTDKPLSVADKTLSMADKTFSVADKTFSMTDNTFSVADQTPSMTEQTFSTAGMMGLPGNQPPPSSHHGTDSSHLGRHGRARPASALGHTRPDVGWICAAAHP